MPLKTSETRFPDSFSNKSNDDGVCSRDVDLYQALLPQGFLSLHRTNPKRYPHLLESVAKGSCQSRFDLLFAFPGDVLEMSSDCSIKKNGRILQRNDVLSLFDILWAESAEKKCNNPDIPFSGGWFVFLAYELAAIIEPGLHLNKDTRQTPVAVFTRIPAAIILDHTLEKVILVAEENKTELLDLMQEDLLHTERLHADRLHPETTTALADVDILEALQEDDANNYIRSVEKIKNYITEGDVFQVNLSRRWLGKTNKQVAAADIYDRLKQHNPASFAGISVHGNMSIISSSPERLVKVNNGIIETRPIAGTRPRSTRLSVDKHLSEELITDPKERAEHIMLIDLERNDLGRVCIPGSIKVNELMVVESCSHVHHIVSNIQGELQKGVTPGKVIRAVFPGGTITGCPKVRCMQILAELEETARGPYTGSMGYINHDGSMDLNILIRTIVLHNDELVLQAGGGIVADSDSEIELNETRAKARGLLLALGLALD